MGRNLAYPKDPRNTIHREDDRATYDLGEIHTIVATTSVLHVSFPPDPAEGPFPAILPMIGQMGSFDHPSASMEDPLDCYLHGYVSARMMKLARSSAEGDGYQGLPVSIAATKVDGKVLSLTPFSHSYNYRSAVLFGYATEVTDQAEKLWAMGLITEKVMTERWANSRVPPDQGEMSSTTVLRVKVVNGSGKIRDGGPHDYKKDLDNEETMRSIWTGVVPMWESYGQPQASSYNRIDKIPDHISSYCSEANQDAEAHAVKVAHEPAS